MKDRIGKTSRVKGQNRTEVHRKTDTKNIGKLTRPATSISRDKRAATQTHKTHRKQSFESDFHSHDHWSSLRCRKWPGKKQASPIQPIEWWLGLWEQPKKWQLIAVLVQSIRRSTSVGGQAKSQNFQGNALGRLWRADGYHLHTSQQSTRTPTESQAAQMGAFRS